MGRQSTRRRTGIRCSASDPGWDHDNMTKQTVLSPDWQTLVGIVWYGTSKDRKLYALIIVGYRDFFVACLVSAHEVLPVFFTRVTVTGHEEGANEAWGLLLLPQLLPLFCFFCSYSFVQSLNVFLHNWSPISEGFWCPTQTGISAYLFQKYPCHHDGSIYNLIGLLLLLLDVYVSCSV